MHTFARHSVVAAVTLAGVLAATTATAQQSDTGTEPTPMLEREDVNNVRVFLLHAEGVAKPGETTTLALHFVIAPEWHMYWNGYAEDGMAPTWELQLPTGFEVAGDVVWPIPHRHSPSEFVVEHIYEKHLTLLIPLRVASDAKAGDVEIGVKAKWLVCSDRCVPESGTDSITLRVGGEAPQPAKQPGTSGAAATKSDATERPDQASAKKIIEEARTDAERLQPLTSTRARQLGIVAMLVRFNDEPTLQIRAGDKVQSLTWFPANECANPTSEFALWTAEGASLDIPLASVAADEPGEPVAHPNTQTPENSPGKHPNTAQNHSSSVCVRGILEVKTSDSTHKGSEYFVVHVVANAGK